MKFLYRVNDERTREMFDAMVAGDKNNKQIREKIVADIIDDFDRIDGKPTKKVLLSRFQSKTKAFKNWKLFEMKKFFKQ